MLCTVKCLKEDRKLIFQMRNKLCSTTTSTTKLNIEAAGKHLDQNHLASYM